MLSVVTMRTLLSPALMLASLAAFAAPLQQDNLNWLQTMAFAAHQTDYSGIFVYQYGNHVETLRITHIADRDGEHSKLENLDGPRREIIRNNNHVSCYIGDHKVIDEQRSQNEREFPALLPQQLTLLKGNYLIKPLDEERVAGLNTHVFVFQPRDNLRYVHEMWAHDDSGLLLKTAVLDEHGSVIEQYAFTQLTIGGDIDRKWISMDMPGNSRNAPEPYHHKQPVHFKEFHPEANSNQAKDEEARRDDVDAHHNETARAAHLMHGKGARPVISGWKVDGLPDGFQKIAEVSRVLPGKDAPVIQMVFSDGLAGISVFIEKSDSDEDDVSGLSSKGLIQIYTRLVDGHLVTVVGEVPPRTVMQVADSVRYGGN